MTATASHRAGPVAGPRGVLAAPGAGRALGGTLLGRLPAAMAPVQVLIVLSHRGLLDAGALSGAQTLAASLSQPLLARAADRRGQRPVLGAASAVSGTAFVLLAITGAHPAAAAAPLIVLTGLAAPPLQSCLRGRWPTLVEPAAQRSAQALDAASTELLYLIAPLLAVALCLISPAAAFGACAGLGTAGTALVIAAPDTPNPRTHAGAADRLGALRDPGLRALLPVHLALGFTLGAIVVAALHTATRTHHPLLTGLVPAGLYAGSTLGGLLCAARRPAGTSRRHLATALIALTASLALLVPAAGQSAAAVCVAAAAGLWLAPALTSGQVLTQHTAAGHARGEAAGWLVGALGAGEAAGTAVASSPALPASWWPALSTAAAAALLLALISAPVPAPTKDTVTALIPAPRAAADRIAGRARP